MQTYQVVMAVLPLLFGNEAWAGKPKTTTLSVEFVDSTGGTKTIPGIMAITPPRRLNVKGRSVVRCDDDRIKLTVQEGALRFDWLPPRNPTGQCSITDESGNVVLINYLLRDETAEDRAQATWISLHGPCPEVHPYKECYTKEDVERWEAEAAERQAKRKK